MHVFPGFDRLFELSDPVANRPYRGSLDYRLPTFEIARGEEQVSQALVVEWGMGGATPGDVVWTQSAHALIVGKRVIDLLIAEQLTGWDTYPVRVLTKTRDECEGYVGLVVTGRCGTIDPGKSTIRLREMPGGYFPDFVGTFFEPSSWDGSDFVMPVRDEQGGSSSQRIVTERVVTLFMQNGVSNFRFERLSEATCSTSNYEIAKPYLLPQDFNARVAAAYRDAGVARPKRNLHCP